MSVVEEARAFLQVVLAPAQTGHSVYSTQEFLLYAYTYEEDFMTFTSNNSSESKIRLYCYVTVPSDFKTCRRNISPSAIS